MAYRVVRNNLTGKRTLEFYKTFQRKVIGKRGEPLRRHVPAGAGWTFHVTKGRYRRI